MLKIMNPLILLVVGLFLVAGTGASAQQSSQLFTEAQRAYMSGDVETAKEKFKLVLADDPNNTSAANYLRMIAASEPQDNGAQLEKKLKALILPKVEFREATFGSALEYLKQQAAKQSEGKIVVSFVVKLPPEFLDSQRVTLQLKNIPFTEALHYLCELGDVDYRVVKYAILVKKKEATESAAAQPSTSPSATK